MSDEQKLPQAQKDLRDKAVEEATDGDGPKATKFLTGDKDPATAKKREEQARSHRLINLQIQMAAQEDINACWQLLNDVQDALDVALIENAEDIERLEADAARLTYGTLIFRDDETGRFYTADDKLVPTDQVSSDIPTDVSTRQDYQNAIKRRAQLAGIQDDVLDPSRENIQSDELTAEEAQQIQKNLANALSVIEDISEPEGVPLTDPNAAQSLEEFGPILPTPGN